MLKAVYESFWKGDKEKNAKRIRDIVKINKEEGLLIKLCEDRYGRFEEI